MTTSDLKTNLKQSANRINFLEIKIDILKDVLFLISPDLDLLDVAEACALDNKDLFKKWIDQGLIRKPESAEIEYWKEENTSFDSCIVKPFLFLQKAALN